MESEELMKDTGPGEAESVPQRAPVALVHFIFLLSGFAALVDELSWNRLIGLAIGNTASAAALVLASYFTGFAVGQFLGDAIVRRCRPLFAYGIAEIAAAIWACLIPILLDRVGDLHASSLSRTVQCFVILLPATIPLGATLPFVLQYLSAAHSSKRHVTLAYGLNTAGGLLGIVAALAFLLVVVGVRTSGFFAAGLSAVCGLAAIIAAVRRPERTKPETSAAIADHQVETDRTWIMIAAISGFGTLGLEVLFARMFSLVFHNSSYTFGAVVAAFLLALSLGAMLVSLCTKWFTPRQIATASFSLGGLFLAGSIVVFPRLTGLNYFQAGSTFTSYLAGSFGLVAAFVLPPVLFLGMVFPAVLQAAVDRGSVGRLSAANTLAGAIGALAAGFVLPAVLGLWSAFGFFVLLFLCSGVLLLGRKHWVAATFLMLAGLGATFVGSPRQQVAREESSELELVKRWETAYGWVDVARKQESGALVVQQNLHYRHGSTRNTVRQNREGRLPLLLHPKPTEVAFLGLGTGLTATPTVVDKDVESAVIVELIPEVVEASRYLAETNLAVVDHPKVTMQIDDARQYLRRTERQFDVIVADLFVPWESRAGYLYTTEFYDVVRRRLQTGGIFCQWLALYQVGPEEFALIANTFASQFPQTTIWWSDLDSRYPIVALVGSEQPIAVDFDVVKNRMSAQGELPGRKDSTLGSPDDLPALYLGDWPFDPSTRLNTDEHPRLEFTAPISHRSRRNLHGHKLQVFFDEVLANLPATGAKFNSQFDTNPTNLTRHRATQRFSLFGDTQPAN